MGGQAKDRTAMAGVRDREPARGARWLARIAGIGPTWWALIGSVVLALLYTRVTIFHFSDGIAGGKFNGYENVWNDYWFRTAARHLHNPFFTNLVLYPTGASLRFHTLNPLGGLIALPLWPLLGPVMTMNVKIILGIVGSTFCAYLLIRDLTGDAFSAFGGAVVYTFANALMIQYYLSAEENYAMAAALLPLYLFFLLRAARNAAWFRDGIAATLLLFALCLTDWQHTLFAVLFTALYFLYVAATSRSLAATRALLLRFALIGGVWAVVVLPTMVLPMVREARSSPWLAVGDEATNYARSLQHFVKPGADNPGYLVLLVTLVGLVHAWRRGAPGERRTIAFWVGMALFATVISLGPRLELRPFTPTRVPLPAALIFKLPVLNIGRKPQEYYASLAMLAFGVLFAFGARECAVLIRRGVRRGRAARPRGALFERAAAPALIAVVAAISVAPDFSTVGIAEIHPLNPPAFFTDVLAKDQDPYAILELPIFPTKRGQYGGTYAAFQLFHGKARFGASLSRDHNNVNPNLFARHATLFRDFFWQEDTDMIESYRPAKRPDFLTPPKYEELGIPLLNYYHVRYIVLYVDALLDQRKLDTANKTLVYDTTERLVHQVLGADAQPVFRDAVTEIYRVPDRPPLAQPLFVDTGNYGWHAPELGPEKVPYRWADSQDTQPTDLLLFNLSPQPRRARLQFTTFNYKAARTMTIAINGYTADRFALAPDESRDVTLDLTIPPGMNKLTLISPEAPMPVVPDPRFGRDNRLLSFGVRQVTLTPLTG
jgi:hypothetical protein